MATFHLARMNWIADLDQPGATVITEAWAGHTAGYVARLEPGRTNPLYEVVRKFLDPATEGRSAWGNGRRVYRIEEPGVYEAESRGWQRQVRRVWFEIAGDGRVRPCLDRDAAIASLHGMTLSELVAARLADWTQRPSDRGWQRRIERARQANQQEGLPPLEGTPRQVDYAEVVRHQRLAEARRRLRPSEVRMLSEVTSAQWWIDHRRTQWSRLLLALRAPS